MSDSTSPLPSPVRDERWLWLVLAVAWLVNFGFSTVGWDNTLISRYQFRQAQTALTAAYFPPGQFPLAYETPLLGPPWSVPLEFPVYQASVSTFSAATGLPLDPSGRLVSWVYFQLSLPAFFLLLGSAGVRRGSRLICLSLMLVSPLYLFFSRTFLIESTVLCFCAWFLAAYARWLTDGRIRWLIVAAIAGSLGACVKATTMVGFGFAGLLFAFGLWRKSRANIGPLLLRGISAYAVPAIAGLAWLKFTTVVRSHNPEAGFLGSILGFWSFGDIPQRLSLDYWTRTIGVWCDDLLSQGGLVVTLYLLFRLGLRGRAVVVGAFIAFLAAQLIFSNLFMVHNYYFYANGVFLLFAVGLLLGAQFENEALPRWERFGLLGLMLAAQVMTYVREYLPAQRLNHEVPELIQAVHDLTRPDQMIVVLGYDWDATPVYYMQRRALMLINGREFDRDGIRRTIAKLDPQKVGAVVVKGWMRRDETFMTQTMGNLDLGTTPVLHSIPEEIGIWFPAVHRAEARARLPLKPYASFDILPERPIAGAPAKLGLREIGLRREFLRFSPRPIAATGSAEFSEGPLGSGVVLNAHAPTELVFRAGPGTNPIVVTFGIHDGAYTGPKQTDGVEFVIANRTPDKQEHVLFSRLLDPAHRNEDQGTQRAEIPLTKPLTGEIILRTLGGPRGDFSFDWAYWGEIRLR